MAKTKKRAHSGSKSPKGFRNSSSGRGFRPLNPWRVTCAECGDSCEVPFKPTGEKPVYCRACFKKKSTLKRVNKSISS